MLSKIRSTVWSESFSARTRYKSGKKLLVLFLFLFDASTIYAQEMVELSVHFDRGSDIPHKAEMVMLNEVAQYDNSEHLRFWVVGHTDDRGSEKYNRQLSKNRTQTVVYHLLMSGIKPYNIIFEYYGEECPIMENDTKESRAENRRVDIRISNVGPLDEPGFAGRYPQEMFKRPLKDVNPDPEVFVFDNRNAACIETASGTLIAIPPMAFMDAYGRPVGGEVEVTYQEFMDPFAVFVSGINMKYETDGAKHNLETAGMFNINATHRGKPVELRENRPVHVDLVSASEDTDFNLFFLDPATEGWKDLGNAAIEDEYAELIRAVENMSEAARNYMERTDFLSAAVASRTTLEERFQNMEYMHDRPIASYYRFLRKGDQKESKQFRKEWRKQADFQIRVLPHRHVNDEKTIHFKINSKFGNSSNPEWRGFSSRVWEYNGKLDRSAVRDLIQRKRFHNLRVRFNAETDAVVLELKNLDSIIHLPIKKITVENAALEFQRRMLGQFAPKYHAARMKKMHRSFERKYRIYDRSLSRQEQQIQNNADRFDRNAKREYNRNIRAAWKENRPVMTEAESLMSFDIWVSYCEGLSDKLMEYYARQQGGNSVIRALTLNRMGIYNCDRIFELKAPQEVKPRFVLSTGKAINWQTAYLFDRNYNAVITFNKGNAGKVSIDPASLRMMIVTDKDGITYRLNESEVIAMNRGKVAQRIIHVSEFDHSASSLDEVREMLGLAVE